MALISLSCLVLERRQPLCCTRGWIIRTASPRALLHLPRGRCWVKPGSARDPQPSGSHPWPQGGPQAGHNPPLPKGHPHRSKSLHGTGAPCPREGIWG